MFGEYLPESEPCRDVLNFTINKIQCENKTVQLNLDILVETFINISREACNINNGDVCLYQLNSSDNHLVYCDVVIEDETSLERSGNNTLTWVLYIILRILISYSLSPAWNFVDVIATRVAHVIDVDWAILNFFGSITSAISPLVVGKYVFHFCLHFLLEHKHKHRCLKSIWRRVMIPNPNFLNLM